MKKCILNIKLVEIPMISSSQGNKKPNRCHLNNRGKSVRVVHAIGLDRKTIERAIGLDLKKINQKIIEQSDWI